MCKKFIEALSLCHGLRKYSLNAEEIWKFLLLLTCFCNDNFISVSIKIRLQVLPTFQANAKAWSD